MLINDPTLVYPLALIGGLFGLKVLSSRSALARERAAAERLIRNYRGAATEGQLALDGALATVRCGNEEVRYGYFVLDHYSRRFLMEYEGNWFLAVVTKGQSRPFIKHLDAQRAALVSGYPEWTRSGAKHPASDGR